MAELVQVALLHVVLSDGVWNTMLRNVDQITSSEIQLL